MASNLLIYVPCRVYGVIATAAGLASLAVGTTFLAWAHFGPPPDLVAEIAGSISRAELSRLSLALSLMLLLFGIAHAVIGALALIGRTWAMIAGTLGWAPFVAPSLLVKNASVTDCAGVIVLGVLCLLTLLTVAARVAAADASPVTAAACSELESPL